jgi:hypothetical protein
MRRTDVRTDRLQVIALVAIVAIAEASSGGALQGDGTAEALDGSDVTAAFGDGWQRLPNQRASTS